MTRPDARRASGIPCARAEADAVLYVAGEMVHAAAEEYAGHVQSCPTCAAAVAEERELATFMGRLPAKRASSATRAVLSSAARSVVEDLRLRRADTAQPWYVRLRAWLGLDAPAWYGARLAKAGAWACGVLVVGLSAYILVSAPGPGVQSQPDVPETPVVAEVEWDELRETDLATDLAALRRNIHTLSAVISSDAP